MYYWKNIIEKEVTFFIIFFYMSLDDIRRRNILKHKIMLLRKLFPHFLQFLNDLFFLNLKKCFSIAKIIFFIIQSAKKYNNNKKISGQKIRTGDIVVAGFLLYRCTVNASTLHAACHDTTSSRRRPTFSIIFFGERRAP